MPTTNDWYLALHNHNNNVNVKYIITRCQGNTLFKKKQFKYAMFDYWKLASVEARTLP